MPACKVGARDGQGVSVGFGSGVEVESGQVAYVRREVKLGEAVDVLKEGRDERREGGVRGSGDVECWGVPEWCRGGGVRRVKMRWGGVQGGGVHYEWRVCSNGRGGL